MGKHCQTCDEIIIEQSVIAPLGHTLTDATCTSPAFCSVCNEQVGDALGHSYVNEVKSPTCTEEGYTAHICTICGDSYITDEVAATGHTFDDDYDAECNACEYQRVITSQPPEEDTSETEDPTASEDETTGENSTETNTDSSNGGCRSSAKTSALALIVSVAAGWFIFKKKKTCF